MTYANMRFGNLSGPFCPDELIVNPETMRLDLDKCDTLVTPCLTTGRAPSGAVFLKHYRDQWSGGITNPHGTVIANPLGQQRVSATTVVASSGSPGNLGSPLGSSPGGADSSSPASGSVRQSCEVSVQVALPKTDGGKAKSTGVQPFLGRPQQLDKGPVHTIAPLPAVPSPPPAAPKDNVAVQVTQLPAKAGPPSKVNSHGKEKAPTPPCILPLVAERPGIGTYIADHEVVGFRGRRVRCNFTTGSYVGCYGTILSWPRDPNARCVVQTGPLPGIGQTEGIIFQGESKNSFATTES